MKKSLYIFLVLIVLIFIGSWLLPDVYQSSQNTVIQRPLIPVERMMIRQESWKKWWPGKQTADSVFEFYGTPLTIKTILLNGFTAASSDEYPLELHCTWVPGEQNTVSMTITSIEKTGKNPFKKMTGFFRGFTMQKKLAGWLASAKDNLENDKILYGFKINKTKVKDPYLISTKQTYDHFPGTGEIYSMIGDLQSYIGSRQANATNFPILHVHPLSDSTYEAMVAIATDSLLPPQGNFTPKSMILGFLLEGEVNGGGKTAWEAEKMIERYALDHSKASPAISFQMLVTNRMAEPDTTKWVTRIYYPVFD